MNHNKALMPYMILYDSAGFNLGRTGHEAGGLAPDI
jgi:hypothetical protein